MAAKIDLSSVYRVTAKSGKVYLYAWKGAGAPRLKAEPGSDAFVQELADALNGRSQPDKTKILGLTKLWLASDAWRLSRAEGGMADSTKKNWKPFVSAIQTKFGQLYRQQFDRPLTIRPVIKRWLDARWKDHPRQADMAKQVFSAFLSWLVDEDLLKANPLLGMKNRYKANRADRIWLPEDLARLEAKAKPHIVRAARLAALTGLRQKDLLRLSWSHVGELAIELPTGKTGQSALIPMYGELRAFLATLPRTSPVVLTALDGKPWAGGFGSSWNDALHLTGLNTADLHFHDLRGTAATRMKIGGLDNAEIAEALAWDQASVDRIIRKYVTRDALLRDRIRRLDENTRRTDTEKTAEKN